MEFFQIGKHFDITFVNLFNLKNSCLKPTKGKAIT